VAEGSAANLFIVKNGTLFTPDPAQNVLEGITRRTVLELAQTELGAAVVERAMDRSELYAADEVFLTGTAAGITYINSIDHRTIGDGTMGPLTRALATIFDDVTYGRIPKYRSLLTTTYAGRELIAR
jgi:branched-chain amino acid aminotransferase